MAEGSVDIQMRLGFEDLKSFLRDFTPHVGRGTIFLATSNPRPVGTLVRFELTSRSGTRLLVGEGRVVELRPEEEGKPPRGMKLRLTRVTAESKARIGQMLALRRGGGRTPSRPGPGDSSPPARQEGRSKSERWPPGHSKARPGHGTWPPGHPMAASPPDGHRAEARSPSRSRSGPRSGVEPWIPKPPPSTLGYARPAARSRSPAHEGPAEPRRPPGLHDRAPGVPWPPPRIIVPPPPPGSAREEETSRRISSGSLATEEKADFAKDLRSSLQDFGPPRPRDRMESSEHEHEHEKEDIEAQIAAPMTLAAALDRAELDSSASCSVRSQEETRAPLPTRPLPSTTGIRGPEAMPSMAGDTRGPAFWKRCMAWLGLDRSPGAPPGSEDPADLPRLADLLPKTSPRAKDPMAADPDATGRALASLVEEEIQA